MPLWSLSISPWKAPLLTRLLESISRGCGRLGPWLRILPQTWLPLPPIVRIAGLGFGNTPIHLPKNLSAIQANSSANNCIPTPQYSCLYGWWCTPFFEIRQISGYEKHDSKQVLKLNSSCFRPKFQERRSKCLSIGLDGCCHGYVSKFCHILPPCYPAEAHGSMRALHRWLAMGYSKDLELQWVRWLAMVGCCNWDPTYFPSIYKLHKYSIYKVGKK